MEYLKAQVLGPLLFTLLLLLGNIIRKLGLSFTVMLMILSSIFLHGPVKQTKLKTMECIVDIKNWMMNNFLLLNSEKQRVLIIGPKNHTSNNL